MFLGRVRCRRTHLRAVIGLAGVLAVAAASLSPADARTRRQPSGGGYSPPYAAMVVDAKTGRTLHAVNADAPRIPASLTKVMSLYLLFEQLERGRFSMDSELKVSAYAASQPPTKLGLRPGSTIAVSDAIRSMITLSANDVSVVVAENVAGSEEAFAEQMTRRARSLGMDSSRFYNPHGLPNSPPNITTARDLTILARAIQERFPKYFPLFSQRSFQYGSRTVRGHNRLLGAVEGVDGIKTGYTRASGFNLMTSARSEGRQIVSIVLGGRSGASRDKIMRDLVIASLPRASTGGSSSVIAEAQSAPSRPETRAEVPMPPPSPIVAAASAPEPAPRPVPRPNVAQELQAPQLPQAARAYVATTTPIAPPRPVSAGAGAQPLQLSGMRPVAATTTPSAMRWSVGAQPADAKILRPPADVETTSSIARAPEPAQAAAQPMPAQQARVELRQPEPPLAQPAKAEPAGVTRLAKAEPINTASDARPAAVASGSWVIQLGATDDEAKAREILNRAKARAGSSLAAVAPVTQRIEAGGTTLYRARFAGFEDPKDAQNVCTTLKRSGFACFATRS